jgi:hypothetical protein
MGIVKAKVWKTFQKRWKIIGKIFGGFNYFTYLYFVVRDTHYESFNFWFYLVWIACVKNVRILNNKYMKWFYDENRIPYPIMFVHSMNPVGTEKIINLFKILNYV